MNVENTGFEERQNVRFQWTQNKEKRARREVKEIEQILAQWDIPEEFRQGMAKEIFEGMRKNGFAGPFTKQAVIAFLEGEL